MRPSNYSILVVRYSSMGDVILVAPLLAALREQYPDAYIALLTQHPYADLFKDDRRLSTVFTVRRREYCHDPELTGREWNCIIDLQNNHRSAMQIRTLRSSLVCRLDKLHWERFLLFFLRINRYRMEETVASRYIRTGNVTTPPDQPCYRIPFQENDQDGMEERLQPGEIERPVIAFFPFSAWKNKEWRWRSFVTVGRYFLNKGWNVMLLGGTADRIRADRMCAAIGGRCISFAGRLTLHECGCLLKHCTLALGCDTGLSHLARACGVKTGFLFGPTTWHFGFQPRNDLDCTVFERKMFCRPCHPHGGNICWRLDHACMNSLSPEEVITGMMQLHHG